MTFDSTHKFLRAERAHAGLFVVLLLHLGLALAFTSLIPLGEAPDEPAHFRYARFIAEEQRLPATLAERREAGYRSSWPPLYHLLLAGPIAQVGDAPPTRLKAVGDTARRLIPTNGQTIAAFIHTADEAWPWRGITLAWHLSRLVSVLLTLLTVILTYLIAWQLTQSRWLATAAAAIHAFWPQALFVGTVVTDDVLLIFLSGLVLFVVIRYTKAKRRLSFWHFLLLGALLGLALATKYNALPLVGIVLLWLLWLVYTRLKQASETDKRSPSPPTPLPMGEGSRASDGVRVIPPLLALFLGALLSGGWWFAFVWRHFNQVDSQGFIRGSLAALSAGTSDASLRQLAGGSTISLPALSEWGAWLALLFQSVWGLFGGGGTIPLPGWIYGLLLGTTLLALAGLGVAFFKANKRADAPLYLFLLAPLFFLPLPLLRFILSGSLVETAQGRHLLPALPALALALTWGLAHLPNLWRRQHRPWPLPPLLLAGGLFGLSLFSIVRIRASYPPPIPLRTTAAAFDIAPNLDETLAEPITLAGFELGALEQGVLPLQLLWQADGVPAEDYLIDINVVGPNEAVLGGWRGHPVGGRYPTRAWDKGDFLRDDIPVPLLPGSAATEATIRVQLLDYRTEPVGTAVQLGPVMVPAAPAEPASRLSPAVLRADGLPPDAPFSYRATLSFRVPLPPDAPLELAGPGGKRFTPNLTFAGTDGRIAHFIVGADWSSGDYQLATGGGPPLAVPVENRPRRFEPPPVQHRLDANFAGRLTLLGYDLPRQRVAPGDSFPVTLHLQANRTMGQNLAIFNHLLDRQAVQRGGVDRIPQNFYTTLLWVPGEVVSDAYDVPVEPDAPPGVYWLDVGLYPTDRPGQSLRLVVNGQPIERSSVAIGPIKVGGPPPGVTTQEPQPQTVIDQTLGQEITLLGYTLTNPAEKPVSGPTANTQDMTLTLYWQPETIPQADYTVFVHLLDQAGQLAAQADGLPAGGAYPTSLWEPGETIIDGRPLPALPPGRYTLLAGLYRPDTGARLPVEGTADGAVRLLELVVE